MSRSVFRLSRGESRSSKHTARQSSGRAPIASTNVKVENITKHTWFEEINYRLNVLVPLNESRELMVPVDSYLQQVHYGENAKWRVMKNQNYNLPTYLTDHVENESIYKVTVAERRWFGPLELGSNFLKKWDMLALCLLLFTASVTPYETAFVSSKTLVIDLLFLINRFVDIIFFIDIFIQMRTPYRDPLSGRLVLDVHVISKRYLTSWFPMDIISVLPFEFLQYLNTGSQNLGVLQLLRFFRLTRLLKLLRVFRASRKLKRAQIASGLRYFSLEFIKIFTSVVFLIHWFACGYRLVADQQAPTDPQGWIYHYKLLNNITDLSETDAYFASVFWSAGMVTLTGVQRPDLAPSCAREYIYALIVNIVCYLFTIYIISIFSAMTLATGKTTRNQDILVDNYLEIIDSLRLDPRLKFTVFSHLTDHFAEQANHKQSEMLRSLPKALHAFISIEIFMDFIQQIPFLEVFIDMHPLMIQEISQNVERRMIAANNFLFNEGVDGIYFVEEGIVSMDGVVYKSGSMIGLTCLRNNIKVTECRALADIKANFLPRSLLLEILGRSPKVLYYCKRWTQWQLLRDYIFAYSKLYYTAARRGALMNPPLYSKRPNMQEGEEDDIDVAVLDHIAEMGF